MADNEDTKPKLLTLAEARTQARDLAVVAESYGRIATEPENRYKLKGAMYKRLSAAASALSDAYWFVATNLKTEEVNG